MTKRTKSGDDSSGEPEWAHARAWDEEQRRKIDADPKKREALRLVEVFLATEKAYRAARRAGHRAAITRLARELEEARAAASGADPHAPPKVADVLGASPVDPHALVRAIAPRLSFDSPPVSLRGAPRQVVRAVLMADMEVGCGGFVQFSWNARGWFRVAARAFAAMGRDETAKLVRAAWMVAETERDALRNLDFPDFQRASTLTRFDDEGWRLIHETLGAPLVAYVAAHEPDFLDLDFD